MKEDIAIASTAKLRFRLCPSTVEPKLFVYAFYASVGKPNKDSNVSMTTPIPGASDTDFFKRPRRNIQWSITIPNTDPQKLPKMVM